MKSFKVGILGATGAVGQEMQKILVERDFPVSELHLLASKHSAGKVVKFKDQDIVVPCGYLHSRCRGKESKSHKFQYRRNQEVQGTS